MKLREASKRLGLLLFPPAPYVCSSAPNSALTHTDSPHKTDGFLDIGALAVKMCPSFDVDQFLVSQSDLVYRTHKPSLALVIFSINTSKGIA